MNEDLGQQLVDSLGSSSATFFECDVTDTNSIELAMTKSIEWTKNINRKLGGVIAAAGVANPGIYSKLSIPRCGQTDLTSQQKSLTTKDHRWIWIVSSSFWT